MLFLTELSSLIWLCPMKIISSMFDKVHIAWGTSSVESISEYSINETKLPVDKFIFPKNESSRQATNK